MNARTLFACLLLLAPLRELSAQVVVGSEGLVPSIGEVREAMIEVVQHPLSDLDIAVGDEGGPQVFDLTHGPSGGEGWIYTTWVLDPGSAPEYEQYPGADYVILMRGPAGIMEETYVFAEETPTGSRTLGVVGGGEAADALAAFSSEDFESGSLPFDDYYPLTFGKQLGPVDLPLSLDMGDFQMFGTLTLEAKVDAWGTVVVPAGRFDALRLHQWSSASFSVAGAGQDTMRFTQEVEQYAWIAPGVGQVAYIQEMSMDSPGEMGVSPPVTTTVYRLESFLPGSTAILRHTWGRIKAGLLLER